MGIDLLKNKKNRENTEILLKIFFSHKKNEKRNRIDNFSSI